MRGTGPLGSRGRWISEEAGIISSYKLHYSVAMSSNNMPSSSSGYTLYAYVDWLISRQDRSYRCRPRTRLNCIYCIAVLIWIYNEVNPHCLSGVSCISSEMVNDLRPL